MRRRGLLKRANCHCTGFRIIAHAPVRDSILECVTCSRRVTYLELEADHRASLASSEPSSTEFPRDLLAADSTGG
jgi:hypothetical protein